MLLRNLKENIPFQIPGVEGTFIIVKHGNNPIVARTDKATRSFIVNDTSGSRTVMFQANFRSFTISNGTIVVPIPEKEGT